MNCSPLQATDLIVDVYVPEGGSDILISDFDAWTFFVLYIAQVFALSSITRFIFQDTSWLANSLNLHPNTELKFSISQGL